MDYQKELPETLTKNEKDLVIQYVKEANPNFYELEVGNLEENTAYIWGTHTDWRIKKMYDFDNLSQLLKNEEESDLIHKGYIEPQQTLLAYRHEMDENTCGYNSLKEDALYKIHHVPDLGRRYLIYLISHSIEHIW